MKLVTAEEMRRIDRMTIEQIGLPGCVLMENAGRAIAEVIRERFPLTKAPVWIFSGKGNNGGDGFVIARTLDAWGYPVRVWLLAEPDQFQGDAAIHLGVLQRLGIPLETLRSSDQLAALPWETPMLLVDAIFGTGLRGAVRGFAAEVIDAMNACPAPVVSVDIPSGLNADTGVAEGPCVHATLTVTVGLPKRGLPFAPQAGEWQVVDIGFSPRVVEEQAIQVALLEASEVVPWLPPRPRHSHKGDFGRVLVIAGAPGFTGAAALCSEAAARAGAGLVTLGVPKSLNPILEIKLTEVMTLPLPETENGSLSVRAEPAIREFAERVDVLAIGPGLSRDPETVRLVHRLAPTLDKPQVIDADGLNALSQSPETLAQLGANTVLTPHPGEMARLLQSTIAEVRRDPIGVAQRFARERGVVLVLKGAPTVIAAPDGRVWVNTTGNPGMATGGTGDVLTGLIAGFMAQGLAPIESACLGVYVHGLAGDLAAQQKGLHAMLAGDLLAEVPMALQQLLDQEGPSGSSSDVAGDSPPAGFEEVI